MLYQKPMTREINTDDVLGEEIVSDEHVGAGRFRIVRDRELQGTKIAAAALSTRSLNGSTNGEVASRGLLCLWENSVRLTRLHRVGD
jgi:hypothetical protein